MFVCFKKLTVSLAIDTNVSSLQAPSDAGAQNADTEDGPRHVFSFSWLNQK